MNIVEKTFSALLVAALVGCVESKPPPGKFTTSRVVRWVLADSPPSLDWSKCSNRFCLQHAMLTMRGLTALAAGGDPDSEPEAVVSLAESWSSPEKNKLRFLLKPGLRWSNGRPLLPSHFVKGWAELLRTCRQAWLPVRGVRAYCEGRGSFSDVGISERNDRTIEFDLERPAPLLPIALAHPSAFPVSPDPKEPLALGPFVLEAHRPGLSYRYVANPLFSGTRPAFDRIEALVLPSMASRVQLFLDGGADLVEDVDTEACLDPGLKSHCVSRRTGEIVSLVFHTQKRPFVQAASRSAFASPLKRAELSRLAFREEPLSDTPPTFAPQPTRFFRFPVFSSSDKIDLADRAPFKGARPVLAYGDLDAVAENLQAQWLVRTGVRIDLVGQPTVFLMRSPVNRLTTLETLTAFQTQAHWRDKSFEQAIEGARRAETLADHVARLTEAESILVGRESVTYPLLAARRLDLQTAGLRLEYDHFRVWDPTRAVMP